MKKSNAGNLVYVQIRRGKKTAKQLAGESLIPIVNTLGASSSRSKLHLKRRRLNSGGNTVHGRR